MSWFFFPAQKFPGLSAWSRGFKDKLTHQKVADLANWMRAVWGGQDATFTLALTVLDAESAEEPYLHEWYYSRPGHRHSPGR